MNRFFITALCSLFIFNACGVKAPPETPIPKIPAEPVNFKAVQQGENAVLSWECPSKTMRGLDITPPLSIMVYFVKDAWEEGKSSDLNLDRFKKIMTLKGTVPCGETVFTEKLDFGDIGEKAYYYGIIAEDGKGKQSRLAGPRKIVLANAPVAPDNLLVRLFEDRIDVIWEQASVLIDGSTASEESLKWNIYRAVNDGKPELLTKESIAGKTFSDKAFGFGNSYSYFVTAIAGENPAESGPSPTERIFAEDTFPPAAPIGLTLDAETGGTVTLFWIPSGDDDLEGYNIYRKDEENNFRKINDVLHKTSTYRDEEAAPGKGYAYYITAVDSFSNESLPSPAASTREEIYR